MYEQIARDNGFTLKGGRVFDTQSRGMFDYFYSWEDACIYYGLQGA